jgi:hypothetical protein
MLSRVAASVARSLTSRGPTQASSFSNIVRANWNATPSARPGVTSTPVPQDKNDRNRRYAVSISNRMLYHVDRNLRMHGMQMTYAGENPFFDA